LSLSEFHQWVKEVVRQACEEAICNEGFVPDHMKLEGTGESTLVHIYVMLVCHTLYNQSQCNSFILLIVHFNSKCIYRLLSLCDVRLCQ